MVEGRIAQLPRRTVVSVGGPEAESFLNGLVTNDMTKFGVGEAAYGGLLAPQGKVLFDFLVFRDAERFLFDVPEIIASDFIKRLGLYKLRAKVEIADLSSTLGVAAAWGGTQPQGEFAVLAVDPRIPSLGYRLIVQAGTAITPIDHLPDSEAGYDAHRIALGIPEGGVDFSYGEVFPHDVDMDQLGGIAFDKGCYIGQEVVSRMEHRGTARRRIIHVTASSALPAPGAEIVADKRPVGTIASSANCLGLAIVRLDRAKEAIDLGIPLVVDDSPVKVQIPDWARFQWPAAITQS